MAGLGFCKPSREAQGIATKHLYVANCPREIVPISSLKAVLSRFGSVEEIVEADGTGSRVVVSFHNASEAQAAKCALDRKKCDSLNGITMVIQYAVPRPEHSELEKTPVFTSSEELQIPGLYLLTDFVTPDEEAELILAADENPWQLLAKRRVQHYGYEFLYKVRNVDPNKALGELPEHVQFLLDRFSSLRELTKDQDVTCEFDQLTVNEYPRGVGLSPHIDTHSAFQGSIISLSMAGSSVMEFRKYTNGDQKTGFCQRKALYLPQRSLLILSNEARYAWHHYIPHHKIDFVGGQNVFRSPRRVSYTFRKIRSGPCFCTFPEHCDTQSETHCVDSEPESEPEREQLATPEIEKTFVHEVYNAIAPHFSSTRFAKWPKVAEFLESLIAGSVVLDAGCGNGKYLGFNKECHFIGCDISAPLVSICAGRGHQVLIGDAVNLSFRTGSFDAAISIAVLHHLSTESRRRRAIVELVRVVAKGGKILVTVWAAEQEDKSLLKKWTPLGDKSEEEVEVWIGDMSCSKQMKPSLSKSSCLDKIEESEEQQQQQQEYFVPWHLPYHRAEIAGAAKAVASGFARRDDKKSAVVYNRFYHVFVEGELERLVSGLKDVHLIDRFYDKSNWCILLQKR